MPKEQPFLSEHSLSAPSSKTAKDKSNSSTLLAIRNTKDAESSSGRGSRCSSEKDSGYSGESMHQSNYRKIAVCQLLCSSLYLYFQYTPIYKSVQAAVIKRGEKNKQFYS